MTGARLLLDTLRFGALRDATALGERWLRADAGPLVQLAIDEGADIWLHRRLKKLGIAIDIRAQTHLNDVAKKGLAQSLRMDAGTFEAIAIIEAAGIPAVPLKSGALRRIADRVPYADARAPTDVDLIVPEQQAQAAWDALAARGYTVPKMIGPDDQHHLFGLVGPLGIAVEIHLTTTGAILPAEAWRRATYERAVADFEGVERPIPSDTELLWHALVHALNHAEEGAYTGLRLRFWLDGAALLAADTSIDWDRIRKRLDSREYLRPALARAWLRVAAELSGRTIPSNVIDGGAMPPLDLERLLEWRLRLASKNITEKWRAKLREESARGEAWLPYEPIGVSATAMARFRHPLATRAARFRWEIWAITSASRGHRAAISDARASQGGSAATARHRRDSGG